MQSKDEVNSLKEAEKKRLFELYKSQKQSSGSSEHLGKKASTSGAAKKSNYAQLLEQAKRIKPEDLRISKLAVNSLKSAREKRFQQDERKPALPKKIEKSLSKAELVKKKEKIPYVRQTVQQQDSVRTHQNSIRKTGPSLRISDAPVDQLARSELRQELADIDNFQILLRQRRERLLEAIQQRPVKKSEPSFDSDDSYHTHHKKNAHSRRKVASDTEEQSFVRKNLSEILANLRGSRHAGATASRYESEDDLSSMEATPGDIRREEARSMKLAKKEDETEERLERERQAKKRQRKVF